MSATREETIERIAAIICAAELDHPTRVGIDGVPASGKTTLARELASAVAGRGRHVIHVTTDGYHQPRARRYRRGRWSARGYYEDAYDHEALASCVLAPLGPGGDRLYRERVLDLASDEPVDEPPRSAAPDAVLLVDGTFLQRPTLLGLWDLRVFVNASLDIALARGIARDAERLGGSKPAAEAYAARYQPAARRYLEEVRPAELATMVLDNDDLAAPRLRVA